MRSNNTPRGDPGMYVQCAKCGTPDTVADPGEPPVEWQCECGHTNTWKP